MTTPRHPASTVPDTLVPRGLRRVHAAAYVGVSPSKFDELVREQYLPKPRKLGKIPLWDRRAIDAALDSIFDDDDERRREARSGWDAMR